MTRRRYRNKLDPQKQAQAGEERKLQADCEALLDDLIALGRVATWYHRPDVRGRRPERKGLPDLLIGVRHGMVLGVELKTATGKISVEQLVWLGCFGDLGSVCRSQGELLNFLESAGVLP